MISIRDELRKYGLSPQKRLGQHFLIDRNILSQVVETARVEKGDVVLEIGPGLGEMTLDLARRAERIVAVEIDRHLASLLRQKLKDQPNVEIKESDILRVNFREFGETEGRKIKVVANLPYQISTPLLFQFIESREVFSTLTLMLQKEVAQRIVALPGSKAFGSLSIFLQIYFDLSIRFFIPASAFYPRPKVESALVQMIPRENPRISPDEEIWFKKVVKGSFTHRRKMLMNALKHSGLDLPPDTEQRMERIGIDPRRRPETLTIEEFARLAEALKN
jgi:16S rRNA (adenine1518-N6/adenine1519-N6)-dimethyltransferase